MEQDETIESEETKEAEQSPYTITSIDFNKVALISIDFKDINKPEEPGSTILGYNNGVEEQFNDNGDFNASYCCYPNLGNGESKEVSDLAEAEQLLARYSILRGFPSKLTIDNEKFKLVYVKELATGGGCIYYGNSYKGGIFGSKIKYDLNEEVFLKGIRYNFITCRFEKFYFQYLFNEEYQDDAATLAPFKNAELSSYTEDYILNIHSLEIPKGPTSVEIRPTNIEYIRKHLSRFGIGDCADQIFPYKRSSQKYILDQLKDL